MKRFFIAVPLFLLLVLYTTDFSVSATSLIPFHPKLLDVGPSYNFAPTTSFGGGGSARTVMIAGHTYTWLIFLMIIVMFSCIAASTVILTCFIHRYFLEKHLKDFNIKPYLRVTHISLSVFVGTLFLAFIFIFSLWYVLIVGLITQLAALFAYWIMNRLDGYPIAKSDLGKAYMISMSSISLIMMLFLQ